MAKTKKKKSGQRRKKSTPLVLRAVGGAGAFVARHPGWVGGPLVFGVVFSFVSANALWYQAGPHPEPLMKTRQLSDPYAVPGRHMAADTGAVDTFRIEREEDGVEVASLQSEAGGDDLMAILEQVQEEPPVPAAETVSTADIAPPVPETAPPAADTEAPVPVNLLDIQTALAARGYYNGKPDGVNGPMTEAAIRKFQAAEGLPETGVADAGLQALLKQSTPLPQPRPDQVASADPVAGLLSQSAAPQTSDPMVVEIQRGLINIAYDGVTVDGVAGPGTRHAILEFQKHYRLPETGEPSESVLDKLKEIGAL
ncbi:peptidoglycan-binding domain-containing protein [Martelella endophytica]|uniref:Peptidoglycan binding-like domain-containing protein n=1 Tax=Martelella endophytica TaxID=1486262 RepID=A0A0D5LSR4_MAREN|nr:peptidoglycan-binding protein [Martelella endophytica]AJY47244.1 hypothetical protein TM49_18685 [Martelella endophytica]